MPRITSSYNVLILSVGRRVELVQCFKNAADKLNIKSKIVGADCSASAPALYFADAKYLLPPISEPTYIESIIAVCKSENIALIIPTIDTDLLLLSEHKSNIEEKTAAKVLVSDENVIRICRDKFNTQRFFEDNAFEAPRLYSNTEIINGDIRFPAYIKPKDGSSSINAFKVNNQRELNYYYNSIPNPLVQEYIQGDEYSIDVLGVFTN